MQRLAARANASYSPARHPVRALILVPTRELAAQVGESVRAYGRHLKLRSTIIFGGVGINPQVAELRRGTDIVVATPGRLLDHVQQRTIDLRQVQVLVLDEADRMLDMGFIPDIRRILALLPAARQNLLFSATFPEEIRKLAGSFMRDPVTVEVAPRNRPIELVSQVVHPVDRDRKRPLLTHLVKGGNWQQVLVFTKTKHGANRLAQQLERDGIQTDAIHGNKSQNARTRALKRFKDNKLQVLVATDIAARGIDIDALPHVVNFDLPNVPEDYVHRIGRTGRAGASGEAVSLVSADERPLLAAIERLTGRRIEQQAVAGFEVGPPHRTTVGQNARPHQQRQQPRRKHAHEPASRDPRQNRSSQQPGRQDGTQSGRNGKKHRRRQRQRQHASLPSQGRTAPAAPQRPAHTAGESAPRPSAARQLLALFGALGRKAV